jgi:hypothetical protein
MGEMARDSVLNKYSWERESKKLIDFYDIL